MATAGAPPATKTPEPGMPTRARIQVPAWGVALGCLSVTVAVAQEM